MNCAHRTSERAVVHGRHLAGVLLLLASSPVQSATIIAWGDNSTGQLDVPASATNVAAIAAGGYFNLALRSNGTVVAWGQGSAGQTNVPASATNIIAISAGFSHALALRSNGTVVVWGDNSLGGQTNMPSGLTGIKAIAACGFHSLVLRSNGTVAAWGFNTSGQTNVPPSATNVVAIAGGYASLALRSNGTVVSWGAPLDGESSVLPTLTNISAIASGLSHALALRSNGTVVAWGDNYFQQTNIPFGLANIASIGCGANHSFAVESNGFMRVWGRDDFGQRSNWPRPLNGVSPAVGGYYHSLALGYLNDHFADRMPLSGTNVLLRASNDGASTEYGFGEPDHHPTIFSGHTVWFTWTAPSSGGVVLTATNTDFSIQSPILAAYTGSALNALTQVAANSADFQAARAVFTAVAGQTYQIAFAGGSDFGGGLGNAYLRLKLQPPPVNDRFTNATVIAGPYHAVTNSFLGAGRETSEPSHGNATLGQTLWWNWTAPTNGPSPLPVRLMVDGVSFPPGVGVYTGSSVAGLSAVSLTRQSNGMTTDVVFNATPGTTYRIALAGLQNDLFSTASLIGQYRFRLNCRALALSITNLLATTNMSGSVSFTANARIQNLSSITSGPVRVDLSAVSGLSTTQPLEVSPVSSVTSLGTFPAVPTQLTPGQSILIPISGVVPAPNTSDPSTPIAYGGYAALQQQPGNGLWRTVDETLVTFDKWPAIGEVIGPGGGVIRLDPGFIGGSAFNPLISVNLLGPSTALEGQPIAYTGRASYASGLQVDFTNTVWQSSLPSITNGLFVPGSVCSNTFATLTAQYSDAGFVYDVVTNVTVLNLPPPQLAPLTVTGGNFVLQVRGVSNRVHIVEATTNLNPSTVWLPVSTNNLGATGMINLTNAMGSIPQRYFRAREMP